MRWSKVLHLLSKTRWDGYDSWRNIATALKNDFGDKYKETWLALSATSPKFEKAAAIKTWASVADNDVYSGPRITMRTVRMWARLDDPFGYQAIMAGKVTPGMVELALKNDRGLAELAADQLKDVLKVSSSRVRNANIYWFNEHTSCWQAMDATSVLRPISIAVEDVLANVDVHLAAKATITSCDKEKKIIEEQRKIVTGKINYVRSASGASAVSRFLLGLCIDPSFEKKLDSHAGLLGVRNGVIDLHTGELRNRRPDDMLFTTLDIDYDPRADTSHIVHAMTEAMAGDKEMVAYIQRLIGYGATGEGNEEIFAIFTGSGRNGKGVLTQTLEALFGNFYRSMNTSIICDRSVGSGGGASNLDAEKAKLLGTRFAVFDELREDDRLKCQEVQLLSGGDGIPARSLFKDPITITPHHLCILSTNHMPHVGHMIPSLMQRIVVVHFGVTFLDLTPGEAPSATRKQRDPLLKGRLLANLPGVLKWVVDGAVAWYARPPGNLKSEAPARVVAHSNQYFEEQDRLATFIAERCTIGEEKKVPVSAFLAAYNSWEKDAGNQPKKSVSAVMDAKGFRVGTVRIPRPTKCYQGLGLVPLVDLLAEEDGY